MASSQLPIIIIGAGISGLLLAQHLLTHSPPIPFLIYERSPALTSRGVGWGLTLHWSLLALRQLLPAEILQRIPETYVDRKSVEAGRASTFPFFDLSTGEEVARTPVVGEGGRVRVGREGFRGLIAAGVDVQWSKAVTGFESGEESVTVRFEDGEEVVGRLLVACDGGNSRIRRMLFPERQSYKIPISVMGVKVEYTEEQMEVVRKLDPIFLQGTASANGTYTFFSVLDSPGNHPLDTQNDPRYFLQIIISWPFRPGFLGRPAPTPFPDTNEASLELIKTFAESWAEPFRSVANSIPPGTDIKHLELYDWLPPKEVRSTGNVALVGDAFHPMSMYRGEGANHAVVDVLDLVETVLPQLTSDAPSLRAALDTYHGAVTARTRPAVLASRQACMDAHDWDSISSDSPLLSRRAMRLDFDDSAFD